MKYFLIFGCCLILIFSCTKDQMPLEVEFDNQLREFVKNSSEDGSTSYYILPAEDDYANIPQDPKNPLTAAKVELGKLMFYDTGLAQDALNSSGLGTYSCGTCHIPQTGFYPGATQGIADGGVGFGVNGDSRLRNTEYREDEMDVQSARPLSLLNVAFVTNTFWNGQFGATEINEGTENVWDQREDTELNHLGFQGVETQNIEGLHVHRISINKPLLDQYGYTPLFDEAFADIAVEERYSSMTASLAYSAYIRTLFANKAPFQEWLKGDESAMSLDQKKGGILFFGKARCNNCHFRPNLGSLEFHALGVNDMYQTPSFNTAESDRRNLGRGGFTGNSDDNFKFKVPQLYNIIDAQFYFHGSSKRTLDEVIDYKEKAISENENVSQDVISPKFLPVNLSPEEKDQLLSFLSQGLRDPDLTRYQPENVLSGQCFPNNDFQSRIDLGCE